ncbi:heme-dependent oxidative N-demethylase family protein [Jiella sonneratiae]|uniref:DUF3445 domain-containing protein n=1 Tax=Jiella sonneratiae TaxID=2816856 RepID=A0ABS3J8N6_9HYPH|nr:DUF3445 domain-containing protein [Jiella sonneratiae]MBO0906033.1 DUF3445 domain-containing protein [Jiella sonneratiae]
MSSDPIQSPSFEGAPGGDGPDAATRSDEPGPPRYAPYDGSATPFTIGLKPLDAANWIEPDAALARDLAEKRALLYDRFDVVFRETPESRDAQAELLDLLADHLTGHHAPLWRRDGSRLRNGDVCVDLTDARWPVLVRAGLLVSDDLVILQRAEDGWRLTAAHLSFPSAWSLAEKFDQPMDRIHADVPGFAAGSRNAALIDRMFDNLRPERPVWRLNWSIHPSGDLHRPKAKRERSPWPPQVRHESVHVRVERQTLRRLPRTGALAFTIRVYSDPLAALMRHRDAIANLTGLAEQLTALNAAEIAYKGLAAVRPGLLDWLRARAAESGPSGDRP